MSLPSQNSVYFHVDKDYMIIFKMANSWARPVLLAIRPNLKGDNPVEHYMGRRNPNSIEAHDSVRVITRTLTITNGTWPPKLSTNGHPSNKRQSREGVSLSEYSGQCVSNSQNNVSPWWVDAQLPVVQSTRTYKRWMAPNKKCAIPGRFANFGAKTVTQVLVF